MCVFRNDAKALPHLFSSCTCFNETLLALFSKLSVPINLSAANVDQDYNSNQRE